MEADHDLKMNLSRREIRVLLLVEFRLDHETTEATHNICSMTGKDVFSILRRNIGSIVLRTAT